MRRRSWLKLTLLLTGIGLLLLWGVKNVLSSSSQIISPLADLKINLKNSPQLKKSANTQELLTTIKHLIEKQPGVYSVYIFDIEKNSGFGINETTIYTAASVNKILILATVYYETQRDRIDLDERITIQESDIQDFGTGVIRYQGAGTMYSIKSLAQLMMEKSDNTAAYVLLQKIGNKRLQELIDSWGLTQTDIVDNKTSNKDMAQIMVKMFKGQIANAALTQEMIGFMDDSDFENRLPTLLPKDVKVYHKIGNEIGNIHDVGIVALSKKPYYIGVMTNDVTNESITEAAIAQISKIVYDFMSTM